MNNETLNKFKDWLSQRGCDILPETNSYEVLRFRGRETGVIYNSGKTSGRYVDEAIKCFRNNQKWNGQPINIGRNNNYKKQKKALIIRDGTKCFYCGKELEDDITLEHLIPLSMSGSNELYNMVLCHEKCNNSVNNLPLYKKVKHAINMRINNETNLLKKRK